jgi:hypothetical protein
VLVGLGSSRDGSRAYTLADASTPPTTCGGTQKRGAKAPNAEAGGEAAHTEATAGESRRNHGRRLGYGFRVAGSRSPVWGEVAGELRERAVPKVEINGFERRFTHAARS